MAYMTLEKIMPLRDSYFNIATHCFWFLKPDAMY